MYNWLLLVIIAIGKSKCLSKGGECIVKHTGSFATGMSLTVSYPTLYLFILSLSLSQGAICDFYEACA